jgi:MarR family transcriptional regulator for hemolysin
MTKLSAEADMTSTLVRLARLYRSGVDGALTGLGLSDALALPVVVLGRKPEGVRQNALADELGVEGPSLVRLLDRLVENGLVERREDPVDRRAKVVSLTPAGRTHAKQASRALDGFRATLLEGLDPADIQACLRVFGVMEGRLLASRREARHDHGAP